MPRPIGDQVVVITGASSGIGRETALELATRGASVVLGARGEEALREVARQVERIGGRADPVVVDVSEWQQVEALARRAAERFGRIDTWINNAAVSVYGTVEQVEPAEIERIIRVNLIGQLYGMKAALPHLRREPEGSIINVASALADRSVPLQAAYCASKRGIKGFSESLRLELARDGANIHITIIEPSSINTPLFDHARSKVGVKPMPIPPIYEPRVVAEAILSAMEHPRRTIVVGGSGKLMIYGQRISPRLTDRYMLQGDRLFKNQLTDEPAQGPDNLFAPVPGAGATTGRFGDQSVSTSLYTRIFETGSTALPARIGAVALAIGAAALARRLIH